MLTADIFIDVSRKTIQTWTDGRNTKHVGLGATKCCASDPRQNTKHVGLRANKCHTSDPRQNTKHVGLRANKCHASDPRQNTKHVGLRANKCRASDPRQNTNRGLRALLYIYNYPGNESLVKPRLNPGLKTQLTHL